MSNVIIEPFVLIDFVNLILFGAILGMIFAIRDICHQRYKELQNNPRDIRSCRIIPEKKAVGA